MAFFSTAENRDSIAAGRIDFVVTEHGARRIRHLSVEALAEALIEIAAPEFRDALRDDWRALARGRSPAQ
jgi:acyl-CoA hydrolase